MLLDFKRGQGSIILRVKILDSSVSTGAGKTGLSSASSGLVISTIADNEASPTSYTVAGSTIEAVATLGTYAAPTATKCRFAEVSSTYHPGVYELHIADARFAVSSAKSLLISISGATNAAQCDAVIPLRDVDPYDAAAFGMSRLDAAVSSRLAFASYTAPLDAAGTRTAVGLAEANLDTQLSAIYSAEQTLLANNIVMDAKLNSIGSKTNNLPAAPAAVGDIPTAAANAAAWGSRVLGNGRTADMFLQGLTNRIAFSADGLTATLYSTDDTTPLVEMVATRLATTVGALRSVDPA